MFVSNKLETLKIMQRTQDILSIVERCAPCSIPLIRIAEFMPPHEVLYYSLGMRCASKDLSATANGRFQEAKKKRGKFFQNITTSVCHVCR